MSKVQCFMIERLPLGRASLRRFTFSDRTTPQCTSGWGHDASVDLGEVAMEVDKYDGHCIDDWDHADPRWPRTCASCGYEFRAQDEWQRNVHGLWMRPGSEPFELKRAPPGAMWHAVWHEDIREWCGPDGRSLCVMLPDGADWGIDTPARGGGKWTRSGVAPCVTARPSIKTSRYHGFLTNGVLESCNDSQT